MHLHPLQVENCDSNWRLVMDEDDNGEFRIGRAKHLYAPHFLTRYTHTDNATFREKTLFPHQMIHTLCGQIERYHCLLNIRTYV